MPSESVHAKTLHEFLERHNPAVAGAYGIRSKEWAQGARNFENAAETQRDLKVKRAELSLAKLALRANGGGQREEVEVDRKLQVRALSSPGLTFRPPHDPGQRWGWGQDREVQRSIRMAGHHRRKPPPPPQTKVTVGENDIYNREILVGPFLLHKLLGPRLALPPFLILPCGGPCLGPRQSGTAAGHRVAWHGMAWHGSRGCRRHLSGARCRTVPHGPQAVAESGRGPLADLELGITHALGRCSRFRTRSSKGRSSARRA